MRTVTILAFLLVSVLPGAALAGGEKSADPVRILDMSSYTAGASFAEPVRHAMDMRVEEINKAGGWFGRPVEIIHRDDGGSPSAALKNLEAAVHEHKPMVITGCNLADIELAISSWARQNKVLQISACLNSDEAIWQENHALFFRGSAPTLYGLNRALAERAAEKGRLKWAAVNHSYAWGQSNYKAFRDNLTEFQGDAQWVEEQWVPVGKMAAGPVVNAILRSGADAIYTSMWGSDLVEFIRIAKKRGLTEKAIIVADFFGRPEFWDEFKNDIPAGSITSATLAASDPRTPEMKKFAENYTARHGTSLRSTALLAYAAMQAIEAGVIAAGAADGEKIAAVLPGLEYQTVFGNVTMRKIDHVPTYGMWIAETGIKDGAPVFIHGVYKDGVHYFPADAAIEAMRKKDKQP